MVTGAVVFSLILIESFNYRTFFSKSYQEQHFTTMLHNDVICSQYVTTYFQPQKLELMLSTRKFSQQFGSVLRLNTRSFCWKYHAKKNVYKVSAIIVDKMKTNKEIILKSTGFIFCRILLRRSKVPFII